MIAPERKHEFLVLYNEFVGEYLSQPVGQRHLARYNEVRQQGRENFQRIAAETRDGEFPTDRVLQQLLPHTDSVAHRTSGAWVHIAPAIQGDIKVWFEAAGWTHAQDWPKVATAILSFVLACVEDPSKIDAACRKFVSLPYSTGLQTGILTPILNALRPDDFLIVNNKSRKVINYFAGTSFKQRLTDYPRANETGKNLIALLQADLQAAVGNVQARPADLFDMFCHWMVAERRHAAVGSGVREGRVRVSTGEIAVSVPENDDAGAADVERGDEDSQVRESHKIQATLAEIGTKMGFQIWIPRGDRGKVLEQVSHLRDTLLDELPLNYIDITLKTIGNIDVIWIKKHSIARAFEVEHTTAIYSGLLRMADLLSLQPDINIRLHIVAPDQKREKVMRELKRPIFGQLEKLPLYQRCSFISYSSVMEVHGLRQLEYMNDAVLSQYEEFAEDE